MLDLDSFLAQMEFLASVKGWKLDEFTLKGIYEKLHIPTNNNEPLVDDKAFSEIAGKLLDDPYAKPDAVVRACREHRKIQQNSSPPPALPPAPAVAKPCPEFVKFKRLGREVVSKGVSFRYASRPPHNLPTRLSQSSTCKHSTNGEPLCNRSQTCKCLQEWDDRPLTDEDWQLAANTDPAKAIANALGFRTVEGGGNYAT